MSHISVAIIGAGLVGKEVINQLLLPAIASHIRVDVLTNSKYQIVVPINRDPVDPLKLLSKLPPSSTPTASGTLDAETGSTVSSWSVPELIQSLVERSKGSVPHIVVDCTSDNDIASSYPLLAKAGIHIVTPNKKAFSGSQQLFDDIWNSAKSSGSLIYQESTVGAGLPVISTLKDLLATGDKIKKVEGVLSGTFSYIFNNFSKPGTEPAPKFSEVVAVAKENGYTEPHPADDLNGSDVARKLCILSRIINAPSLPILTEGYASVTTQSLIPAALENVASGSEFVARLPEFDAYFEQLRAEAFSEGKVLRFVALIDVEAGKVKAGLEKYPFNHPFASALSGSDNIVSFLTERYPNPLIIQGSGAGAAVTAMGVVSDMIKIIERIPASSRIATGPKI